MIPDKLNPYADSSSDSGTDDELDIADSIGDGVDDIDELNRNLISAPYIDTSERDKIGLGQQWTRTLFTNGWPDEPETQFLNGPINKPSVLNDMSIHIDPQDSQEAQRELKKIVQDLRISSGQGGDFYQARVHQETLQQADAMLETLRQTETELFEVSMYTTIRANTKDQLDLATENFETDLGTTPARTDQEPAVYSQLDALQSVSPIARDILRENGGYRTSQKMMGGAVGAMLPFTSRKIIEPEGTEFGIQAVNGSPVIVDRWDLDNGYNQLTIGTIGAGKSFSTKLQILRTYAAYDDVIVFILDPLQGYRNIVQHLDGEHVLVGGDQGLNPLEIRAPEDPNELDADADPLGQKMESVLNFFRTFLELNDKQLNNDEFEAISFAVHQAYRNQGITPDPATHNNPSPTVQDVRDILADMAENPAEFAETDSEKEVDLWRNRASSALAKLQEFKEGRELHHLARETELNIFDDDVVYLDLSRQEGTGGLGLMMQVLFEQVYQRAKETDKKVLFCIDEAHYIMKDSESLDFLVQAIRHSRHYDLGVNFITQTAREFLVNDKAETIADNCIIKLFHKTEGLDAEAGYELGLDDPTIQYVRQAKEGSKERGYSEALLGVDGNFMPIQVHPEGELEAMLAEHSAEEILEEFDQR